jgi:hypothetical protein
MNKMVLEEWARLEISPFSSIATTRDDTDTASLLLKIVKLKVQWDTAAIYIRHYIIIE